MYINKIQITYTNMGSETYTFSPQSNLITSNGHNTRGKTSLIRFIIWGLGFNVALTNQFKMTAYSETNIELKESNYKNIKRRGNNITLHSNNSSSKYTLPNDETDVLGLLFPNIPIEVLKQLLGFMYFDQDGGYRAWNRNIVTQRFSSDRAYKISIEALLASLENINYKEYISKRHSLQNAKKQTSSFTKLISTIESENSSLSIANTNISDEIRNLNEKISIKKMELNRIIDKKNIYTTNLKDQNNFDNLLKKLSIKIKINSDIIDVNSENIIHDKHLKTKLLEFERHYNNLEQKLNQELKGLIDQRNVLISTNESDNNISLFEKDNSFKQLQRLISASGIVYEDSYSATEELSSAYKKNESEFHQKLKMGNSYSKIWNSIISLANDIGLHSEINNHNNELLINKINESGAKRSLVVMIYRLGILRYLYKEYDILPPLILDSPASSEMDQDNLSMLISMILTKFPEFQIIIATNQKNNIEFSKTILIKNGVLNTFL